MIAVGVSHTAIASAASRGLIASGQTSEPGATVTLYLLSENESDTVDSNAPVVASTTSDSQGNFNLYSGATSDMSSSAYENPAGFITLMEVAASGTTENVDVQYLQRTWEFNDLGQITWSEPDGSRIPWQQTDMSQPDVVLPAGTGGPAAATQPSLACTHRTRTQHGVWTVVGEYHSRHDVSGYFKYGATADTTTHFMINTGSTGWRQGSAEHISASTAGVASKYALGSMTSTKMVAAMTYRKDIFGGTCSYLGTQIHAKLFDGGLRPGDPITGVDGQCVVGSAFTVDLAQGQEVTRSSSAAHTWEVSATPFGVAGFTARSGYSRSVISDWTGGYALPDHYICGNDNVFSQAHRVFAGID